MEKINRPSSTPNEPVIIGIRLDENNQKVIRLLDGHHRVCQALKEGKTTIMARFD